MCKSIIVLLRYIEFSDDKEVINYKKMPNVYMCSFVRDCTASLYMLSIHSHAILFACYAIICCGRCAWRETAEGWNESAVCTPCSARALLRRRHVPRYCTLTLSGTMLRKAVKSAAFRAKFSARTVTFLLVSPSLPSSLASALKMRMCKLPIFFLFLQHRKIHVYVPLSTVSG